MGMLALSKSKSSSGQFGRAINAAKAAK